MASARIEKLKRALTEGRKLRDEEIVTAQAIIAFAEELVAHPIVAEHLANHPMIVELKPKPSAVGPLGFSGKGGKGGKKGA
jgi:hypothetical protein